MMPPRSEMRAYGVEGKTLVVGREISLAGQIAACDKLVVEGSVEADLDHCRQLDVAPSGFFKGSAEIDEAEICGRFEGTLTAHKRLRVRATARIKGSVTYGQIEVEAGGEIVGEIKLFRPEGTAQRPAGPEAPRERAPRSKRASDPGSAPPDDGSKPQPSPPRSTAALALAACAAPAPRGPRTRHARNRRRQATAPTPPQPPRSPRRPRPRRRPTPIASRGSPATRCRSCRHARVRACRRSGRPVALSRRRLPARSLPACRGRGLSTSPTSSSAPIRADPGGAKAKIDASACFAALLHARKDRG